MVLIWPTNDTTNSKKNLAATLKVERIYHRKKERFYHIKNHLAANLELVAEKLLIL